EGPYRGQLSARGETIVLTDKTGRIVTTNTFLGNPTAAQIALRVTEIMYHPPKPPAGSPFEAEDFEYIEFKNIGATPLNLTGVQITAGVEFSFTGSAITSLAPGQHVLVVKNLAAFTSRYGSGLPVAGQYVGFLDNGGENIQIDDSVGEKVQDFTFNNAWYPITDGPGASLVIVNENAPWDSWDLKESWRASFHDFGSPAQNDPTPVPVLPVVINEVLTHTDLPSVDQIELFNGNSTSVDISGWFLSDDFASPKKYRIPNGPVLAAGGYRTFTEAEFNAVGSPTAFSLSSNGDEVYLFSGDGTNITGYVQGYSFEAAANGVSFGRYVNSQTNIHFVAQIANTFGAANSGPRVGPVVISEINYRPVDLTGGIDNTLDEYIELANVTGGSVPLFDPAYPTNTWRVRGGIDFDLPTGITLPAGGYLLVVHFNPTNTPLLNAFRGRFNVPNNVPVVGPFSGNLANTGEEIHISRSDTPDIEGIPYIVVDAVEYGNRLPWPASADGIGPSLQRKLQAAYGNDRTNWTGVGPSPGNPFVPGGSPPVVTQQPQDTSGVVGKTATFSITVSGTSPLFYQWRFNGTNIYGANNSMLVLNQLTSASAGLYSCVIFNAAGSVESNPGRLTIFLPPSITSQPADVKVRIRPDPQAAPVTNASFAVSATSSSPIRYQWLFNGTPILNATNPTYTVVDVKETNYGQYVCNVTDNIDSVPSMPATLYPLVNPVIRVNPASHTNNLPPGVPLGLSVSYTGFPPPFTNEWRRGSLPIGTTVVVGTNDVFATTVLPGTNTYRVVVRNIANPAPGAPSGFATVISALDTDGDGIPDSVESAIGLDPNNGADGALDADGDTMRNKDEFLAGTDPNNAASYLKVEQTIIPGTVTISVAAVANKTYSVQYTDDLTSGQWSKLGDIVAKPTDRVEQLTDTQWTTTRFYWLVLPGQQ
ncbi:MAG TPA: lamin tail domain-containing protein, partial [Verrucomicrobiae bacterium]|nr:lamin tail domain-containing protein [Verrucomicrobiae bacterium]